MRQTQLFNPAVLICFCFLCCFGCRSNDVDQSAREKEEIPKALIARGNVASFGAKIGAKFFIVGDLSPVNKISSKMSWDIVDMLKGSSIQAIDRNKEFFGVLFVFMPCSEISGDTVNAQIEFAVKNKSNEVVMTDPLKPLNMQRRSLNKGSGDVCSFISASIFAASFGQEMPAGPYTIASNIVVASENISLPMTATIELKP